MNTDRISELRKEWEAEEKVAQIHSGKEERLIIMMER